MFTNCILRITIALLVSSAIQSQARLHHHHAFKQILHLNTEAVVFSQNISNQQNDTLLLKTNAGREFQIRRGDLVPVDDLYSSTFKSFDLTHGSKKVKSRTHQATVYRLKLGDGTVVFVSKDGNGDIDFVEIHERDSPATFLVRGRGDLQHQRKFEFVTFSSKDLCDNFGKLDGIPTPDEAIGGRHLRRRERRERETAIEKSLEDSRELNNIGGTCSKYKEIKVAISYDEEFCQLYGSKLAAENRIGTIVNGADWYYREHMCATLSLEAILAPETCNPNSDSPYRSLRRDNACTSDGNGDHFLYGFTKYMREAREGIPDLSADTAIQMFTGYPPSGAELGCSWTGTYCDTRWAYNINYMGQPWNAPSEIVIYTHELGHTLGIPHIADDSQWDKNFVMTPYVTTGEGGFSDASRAAMNSYLNKVTCD